MRGKKLYLDTSVPSPYDDERTPQRQQETQVFWQLLKHYEVVVSDLTVRELAQVARKDPQKAVRLADLIRAFELAPLTEEAEALAQRYIDCGILNEKKRNDARHLAVATIQGVDYLVSWNFDDLVNIRTRDRVSAVNILSGYPPLQIIAPPELK